MKLNVLFAEDQGLIRESLKVLLERDSEIETVDLAEDGLVAVQMAKFKPYDVVVLDIQMPKLDGFGALQAIRQQNDKIKIILITTFMEKENIHKAIKLGANGFLLKDISPELFVDSIKLVVGGMLVFQNDIMPYFQMLSQPVETSIQHKLGLTTRDMDIIRHLVDGLSNKEIAEIENCSEGTVKNRVSSILQKLSLDARTQIAVMAIKNGLV